MFFNISILILGKLKNLSIIFFLSGYMSSMPCDFFLFSPSLFQALEIWTYRHWASVSTLERWPSVTSSCYTFFCWESQPWCNCSSKGRYSILVTILDLRIFTSPEGFKFFINKIHNKYLKVHWFEIYDSNASNKVLEVGYQMT